MPIRKLAILLMVASILCCVVALSPAQTATTGQIAGVVTDPSGAVVPGAKVALTSDAGVQRTVQTDSNGRYAFPLLDPGQYRMEVTGSGFAATKVESVGVKITETSVVDVTLKVGATATSVSVTGETPLVQTESSARGTVIDQTQVRELPLPTRNFQQLLALTPGTSGSIQNSSELGRGDAPLYVNGQRSLSNSIVINGIDANSIGTGSLPNLAVPAIDSLQEFIVQTSLYDASQGRNAGGVVAVVTKSGTNRFHGDLYEFLRNTDLDANNFFLDGEGVRRPTYNRNQFGGTFGGPLLPNRAWFFLSYQGTREINGTSLENSLATMFVPQYLGSQRDPASLAAFSVCYGLGGFMDPVAATVLQTKLPNGQYMIPGVPGVTTGSGCTAGNPGLPVLETIPSNSTYKEDQFNANLDLKLNESNRFFAKYFFAANRTNQALYDQYGDGNVLQSPGWPTEEDVDQRLLSGGLSSVISSHLLNEARFGWSTIYGPGNPSQPISSSQLGISSPLGNLFPGMPTMSFTNMFTLGPSPLGINYAATNTYSGSDTLTWTKGSHAMKFGIEYKRQEVDAPYFDVFPNGELFYLGFSAATCPATLGAGGQADCGVIKDFLSGLSGLSVIGSGTNSIHNRANDVSAFFQDDWKATPRLTLNLGLRYDYFGPTTETNGHFVGFDPSKAVTTPLLIPGFGADCPAVPATCGSVVTGGFVQAGNGNLPGFPKGSDSLVKPNYKNFEPRVGFAYQLTESAKAVLRGGYGIYFDRPNMRLYNTQLFNMPYEMLATALTTPNENPFVQVPPPSAFPLDPFNTANASIFPFGGYPAILPVTVLTGTGPVSTVTPVPASGLYPDLKDWSIPYLQSFNLGVQTSFANNWMLDLGYVGATGRKYPRLFSFNQAASPALAGLYQVGSLGGTLFPGFANLTAPGLGSFQMESNANSNYNSLQASLNKRFSYGLQMLLSYTYSHSIDDYSGSDVSDITLLPGNMVDESLNRASSDFDRRQRFVASYLYDLPKFYHGGSSIARQIVNSWSASGIVTLQSGTPFSIYGSDSAFSATLADLATGRTLGSAIKSGNVADRLGAYFDPTAFVAPSAFGDFGQLPRNILRGPKQINTDFSIMKSFPVLEKQRIEFRAELFNLFNNVNFANPVDIVSSANFGQIASTTTGPRVIQFALKYEF